MLMAQPVQLRAVSSPFAHPYLYPVRFLPQAVPTSSRPSPRAISRKPIGILLTLLNATLTRALDSKRLVALLSPLDATLTKNQGGHHATKQRDRCRFNLSSGKSIVVWGMRRGSGVPRCDRIPPWLDPGLSSLCTTFPIDSARRDHPARAAPPFPNPVARLLTFPAANMPCPASSGNSHLSARVRLLFEAAELLRPPAIVPSANFPSLGTVARSGANFAPAIGLPCDTHPSPHPVALPIPESIPNYFQLWRRADPTPAPSRMLCVLREGGTSCNTRAPENTRPPYSSAPSPRLSPATWSRPDSHSTKHSSAQRFSNHRLSVCEVAPLLCTSPATLRLCPRGATHSQANTVRRQKQHAPEDNAAMHPLLL